MAAQSGKLGWNGGGRTAGKGSRHHACGACGGRDATCARANRLHSRAATRRKTLCPHCRALFANVACATAPTSTHFPLPLIAHRRAAHVTRPAVPESSLLTRVPISSSPMPARIHPGRAHAGRINPGRANAGRLKRWWELALVQILVQGWRPNVTCIRVKAGMSFYSRVVSHVRV